MTFADDFRLMAAALPRRVLPAPVFKPVPAPEGYARYTRTCSLCDSPTDAGEVCSGCNDYLKSTEGRL